MANNVDINFKTNYEQINLPIDNISDSSWLKNTFILSDKEMDINKNEYQIYLLKNRYRSTADYKFTSSAPGMNLSCNPKPQYTRYADLRSKGKLNNRLDVTVKNNKPGKYGYGMGRYYSRAIDDNEQRIYMVFGNQEFTPITAWLKNSFDIKRMVLINRGMLTSTLLMAVDLASTVFALSVSGLFIGIGLILMDKLSTSSRFYKVAPQPHLYWATVEEIVNQLFSKRTLLPNSNIPLLTLTKTDNTINNVMSTSGSVISSLHDLLPDIIINNTGRISIFALALKAQNAFNIALKQDIQKNNDTPVSLDFLDYPIDSGRISHDTYFTNAQSAPNFLSKMFDYASKAINAFETPKQRNSTSGPIDKSSVDRSSMLLFSNEYIDANTGEPISLNEDPNNPNDSLDARIQQNIDANSDKWRAFRENFLSMLTDGGMFAVFNVESTGSVGESFNNSSTENPLQSTINGFSSTVRGLKNVFGGAIESISSVLNGATFGVAGEVGSFATDTAATFVSGATFGLANPILAILYGVNFELAKVWSDSQSQFPRASYKMKLISPYGNAFSQLFNIYVPLAMILAGALPRGTGSQTYSSPFFCQLYDRGRVQTQLGMIESLSVTRGTSNLAFTKKGQANAIDVEFSVANLDTVLFTDIATSGIGDPISRTVYSVLNPIEKDNAFTDYMRTIAGLDIYNQIYYIPKVRLKLAETLNRISAASDPAAYSSYLGSKISFINYLLGNNGKLAGQAVNN